MVTKFGNVVEERGNHVVLKPHLRELVICVLCTPCSYDFLKQVCNGFLLVSLVNGLST
jgi:hypothetical protein